MPYFLMKGTEMSLHIVVGAGPVGRETARLLSAAGHMVKLVSRRGMTVVAHPTGSVEGVALDAQDGAALAKVSAGAEAIFMCAMAPYDNWPAAFPPIMEGVVRAAEAVGAKLLITGNVYGYGGDVAMPLMPATALAPTSAKGRTRVEMWQRALAARVPALEIRASDYLGQGAGSLFTLMALPSLLAGETVALPADPDALHAWSYTKDVARTLVAASHFQGDWDRAFHVPSQHATVRDLTSRFAALAVLREPEIQAISSEALAALARETPFLGELIEMAYLYRNPCIVDASETESLLGVSASSLDTMILDTLRKP